MTNPKHILAVELAAATLVMAPLFAGGLLFVAAILRAVGSTGRSNSKIVLSLNDYAHLVSKRILPDLLGASSNNRANEFLAPRIAATICSWNFGLNSK
jgi:hypothetical protein